MGSVIDIGLCVAMAVAALHPPTDREGFVTCTSSAAKSVKDRVFSKHRKSDEVNS